MVPISEDKQGAVTIHKHQATQNRKNSPATPELGSKASEASLSEFSKARQLMNVKMKTLTGSSLLVEFEAEKTGQLKLLIVELRY